MDRRQFFGACGAGAVAAVLPAVPGPKVRRFHIDVRLHGKQPGPLTDTGADGGFIVPAEFVPALLSMKPGVLYWGESIQVDVTPRTIEEVCRARGIVA